MNIPIFLSSDENYSPFLCTTMYSILEHTKSFIEFHILDGGILDKSKKLIDKSLKKFKNQYSIEYHDMSEFNLAQFPNLFHLSTSAYARFFIPNLVKDFNKILYLDVDIIVNGNIDKLYDNEMDNYPIAACLHSSKSSGENFKKHVYPQFKDTKKYFNSGVLLMDIDKFRKNDYVSKLVEICLKYKDKLQFADQDVFNIFFEDNFKELDCAYNFFPIRYKEYNINNSDCEKLLQEIIIFHYIGGGCKPWQNKYILTADKFWQVANKTKFKKRIKKIYKEKNEEHKKVLEFILNNIFSVKNEKNHKVWTILGIKFKRSNNLKASVAPVRESNISS